jgi:hypothetical protein
MNIHVKVEDDGDLRTYQAASRKKNIIGSDLLLARLFQNHKDQLAIQYRVVDIEPRELPPEPSPKVVPIAPYSGRDVPLKLIAAEAAEFYGIELRELLSDQRSSFLIRPRHVAFYLATKLTLKSLPEIGRIFRRDHTTILQTRDKITKLLKTDERLGDEISVLRLRINQALLKQAVVP